MLSNHTISNHNKMIVLYVDIIGDLFHIGYIELFKELAKYADLIYVGVYSDKSAMQLGRQTIMKMDERIEMIESCKYVDRVLPNAPLEVTNNFLNNYGITIFAHGEQFMRQDNKYVRLDVTERYLQLDFQHDVNTDNIIKRVWGYLEKVMNKTIKLTN